MNPPPARPAGWLTRPIFLTSTFRDLHAERDWLREHVFPELEERLRGRRVVIEPIDLRLGVDTASVAEGERELQVLQVCLAEIERSRPFLIGLVGERYGWIPPPERMRAAADEAGFTGEVAGKSVTELEIAYGVLASPAQQRRSYFYLRDPLPCSEMDPAVAADYADRFAPDAGAGDRAEKLTALKARLAEELPDRLRSYHATWDGRTVSGLEAFGAQVLEDLWRELDVETRERIGAPPPTWQESERQALQEFLGWRASGFLGRQAELEQLERLCRDGAGKVPALCLTGEAGAGKSALLAALAQRLTPRSSLPADPLLLVHAAGVSPRSGQAEAMIRRWVGELAQALGIPEPIDERTSTDDLRTAFHDLLRRAAARWRVILLIDALNQFVTGSGSPLSWLPTQLPENVRLIASAISGAESEAFATHAGCACEALPPLDETASARIIEALCARYHRTLNARVTQALLAKRPPDGRPASGNPLWLTLAVDELNRLDAADFARAERDQTIPPAERLTRFLIALAEELPVAVAPAYQWLLERAEGLHGVDRCRGFAASLALARAGLREADFAALWPQLTDEAWQPLAFAALRRTLRTHVVARGAQGQWDCTHAQMREAALARYLPEEHQRREGHALLAAHFGALAADDPLHQSETMVHLIGADDRAGAAALYGGELTDGELVGATAALAEHILQDSETGAAWVAGLTEQLLAPDVLWRLGVYFVARLNHALEPHAPLASRRRLLEASLQMFERFAADDASHVGWQLALLIGHESIGDLRQALGDLTGAGTAYQASLAIAERVTAIDPGNARWQSALCMVRGKVGDVLRARGDFVGADVAYDAALALAERLTAADSDNPEWQSNLAASHVRIGDLRLAQGNLTEAGMAYRGNLSIAERLAAADPGNAGRQRGLAVSHNKVGDLLKAQGDLPGAGAAYRADLAIAERLAALDPGNADRQRDLSRSHARVGDVLVAVGNRREALVAFRQALAITEAIAARDPANSLWQRDLAAIHQRIGDILLRHGDLPGALATLRRCHSIIDALAASDPTNTDRQHDLSLSHDNIGDVLKTQGEWPAALAAYRKYQTIAETLIALDRGHAEWQRDLSVSHMKVGDVLLAQGDGPAALVSYRQALVIREALVARDPTNTEWQRDLSVSHMKVGDVLLAQGDGPAALVSYRQALVIREALVARDPTNTEWQRDLSVSHERIGDVLTAQGERPGALAKYRQSLAIAEAVAAHDSANAEWQRDLVSSYIKMGAIYERSDRAKALVLARTAYAKLSDLKRRGKMRSSDEPILEKLRNIIERNQPILEKLQNIIERNRR